MEKTDWDLIFNDERWGIIMYYTDFPSELHIEYYLH